MSIWQKIVFNTANRRGVLLELWSKNNYVLGQGPVNVYKCDDCGQFHMTSNGQMNERLAQYLSGKKAKFDQEASKWIDKLKHKR
jgi:hypothetical protein